MKLRNANATIILLIAWGIFFVFLWQTVFIVDEYGIRTTSDKLWADWVVHLTFTHVYAEWPVSDWFDTNPLYAVETFRYPFPANLVSSLLLRSGMTLESAMILPSTVSSVLLVAGLLLFFRVAGYSAGWAGVGTGIVLLNGGMGFIAWALGVSSTPTDIPGMGIVIQNFVTSEFVPQRSMLFGAFFFLLLVSAVYFVSQQPVSWRSHAIMAVAGIGAAALLLSHAHSFLTFTMVCAVFAIMYRRAWRVWLTLLATAAIACGLVFALYYAPTNVEGFFAWDPFALITSSGTGFFSFFVLNYGLFLPVVTIAIFRTAALKNPLVLSGLLVFALGYMIRFQPWIWDNTKILTWGYLLLSVAVLQYLIRLWDQGGIYKTLVGALVALLCLSGTIEVVKILRPTAEPHTMFSAEDMDIAGQFKAVSSHRDLVLTTLPHNNWVHALSARPVFKSYTGWLWSYGLDVEKGEELARRMLAGDYELIVDNGIRFLVIDRQNVNQAVNEALLRKLKIVLQSNRYRVYAVNGQAKP